MPTPNMAITTPTVSVTSGPQWASILNAAFDTIDAHDHTSGNGVAIPTAGLNINADLTFNSHNAYGLRTARFDNQTGALATANDLNIVYVLNGELHYRDASGNDVAITAAGSVAGSTGTITGLSSPASAAYSSVSKSFTFSFDSSKVARLNIGDILLYPYDGSASYSNTVTIKAPTSLAGSYSVTMPGAVPSQSAIVSMDTSGVLSTGLADGIVTAPGLAFASDLNTGIYRPSADLLTIAAGGTAIGSFSTTQAYFPQGTGPSVPGIAFQGDLDTGFYNPGGNEIRVVAGGSYALFIGSARTQLGPNGTAAGPSITWNNSTNTGLYLASAGNLSVAAGGFRIANFDANSIQLVDGVAAAPGYAFISDTDTGIYRPGANALNIACGGSQAARFDSSGLNVAAGIAAGGSATFIKWTTYSGSLAASSSTTFTPGGTVLGAYGYTTFDGGSQWRPIQVNLSSGASSDCYFALGTSTSVGLSNADTNSTNSYKVVVIWT